MQQISMNMIKLGQTGLILTLKIVILHILIVLVLNILVLRLISDRTIKRAIFRIKAYDSVMCGYFCIEFTNYKFNNKRLNDFTSTLYYFAFDKKI